MLAQIDDLVAFAKEVDREELEGQKDKKKETTIDTIHRIAGLNQNKG